MKLRFVSLALASWVIAGSALAQAPDASGAALLALVPESLGGHPREDPRAYPQFATESYRIDAHEIATLQIHDVRGAGAEAHQRATCTRWRRVRGREACAAARGSRVSVIWVFDDAVQVMLGAPDEATALRMAAGLDLRAIARLAARIAP